MNFSQNQTYTGNAQKNHRPIQITMIGAGSNFTPTLMRDILCIPSAPAGEIRLCDIDESRLGTMHKIISRLAETSGKPAWKVIASPNRRDLLPGTHYVINSIEVSGLACVRHDNDIPLKYGVDQCIGDTIGPGGLFKGLRTIPAYLDILRDMRELCPKALMLNYTNPMGMMCVAAARAVPEVVTVGLCHSVQGTSHLLAHRAGVPYEQMQWECAGINHLAWFTKLEQNGKDLYPKYLRDGYDGGSSFYANEWPKWRCEADERREKMMRGEEPLPKMERSWEYASWIIEAAETDKAFRIHGNVMNTCPRTGQGPLITNLPHDGCVEVACIIDSKGIHPQTFGKLPPQMAALCDSNMRMIDLAADAVIEKSLDKAIHALMLDPLTAACCSPAEIKSMALELFAAERQFLAGYR